MKRIIGLHVIVGGERAIELATIARDEGSAVIQLRDKNSDDNTLLRIGETLRALLPDTTLIINDRADIALAVGADGLHLGQGDMPMITARKLLGTDAIIGISTSNVEQALIAERAGANYIGFGHMFATRSKIKESLPRAVKELSEVVASVSIPVIAIGGITESNAEDILVPGLGGIAVLGAVSASEHPRATIRNVVKLLEERHAVHA